MYTTILPSETSVAEFQQYLQNAVAPRPIAFASTISGKGQVNLSPFSFFNVFGSNPPLLIFSPNNRVRNGTVKHTLENVQEVPEVVINMVSYALADQMSLSSCEYDKGVNEFIKAGLTEVTSVKVKPPRVGEAPAAFECQVLEVKSVGTGAGAANLILCEVVAAHFRNEVLGTDGKIDLQAIDLIGRMGGDYYVRAGGNALFTVQKPNKHKGMGFDALPEEVLHSPVFTGSHLARLANQEQFPDSRYVMGANAAQELEEIMRQVIDDKARRLARHTLAKAAVDAGNIEDAWVILGYTAQ